MDSHLTFTHHIDQIVARAFTRANLSTNVLCHLTSTRAFTVYVRPPSPLNGLPVWLPHHFGKIIQIESVQRRFTKRLPGLKNVKYKERLEQLGLRLETLEMRRLRQDLIFSYKVLFGLVNYACNDLFTLSNFTIPTRGHAFKLYQRYSRVDSRKHFFAERIIHPWNSQPAKNEHFKSFIKSVNSTNFVSLGF